MSGGRPCPRGRDGPGGVHLADAVVPWIAQVDIALGISSDADYPVGEEGLSCQTTVPREPDLTGPRERVDDATGIDRAVAVHVVEIAPWPEGDLGWIDLRHCGWSIVPGGTADRGAGHGRDGAIGLDPVDEVEVVGEIKVPGDVGGKPQGELEAARERGDDAIGTDASDRPRAWITEVQRFGRVEGDGPRRRPELRRGRGTAIPGNDLVIRCQPPWRWCRWIVAGFPGRLWAGLAPVSRRWTRPAARRG